ncbi:hypothetical protein ACPOL_0909 [Acidisarcina polymorpha]|uniref:Uncharacterized protein n=1 Tax=Acidisarcina polymorpha TaxID=2211140 RepID=A0A2Z5FV29_9BACT|nr:hypothetical protein ACPOL_0909 [Acidisarcina polymorpha]
MIGGIPRRTRDFSWAVDPARWLPYWGSTHFNHSDECASVNPPEH